MTARCRKLWLILISSSLTFFQLAHASGLNWPANQLLPSFSAPAATIDCIDISSASGAEQDLFASMQGIVNRTQPRIACISSSLEEGEFTWLTIHHLPYAWINGYAAITKYATNFTGLAVTDPTQPDTLNLATTLAGLNNELLCDPSLLATLTNAPYNLAIKDDLRGKFSGKYAVYQYLYTNCWPQCTHRVFTGMETNGHGALRDYIVAVKSAAVWLDPGVAADASALAPFISGMTAVNGAYLGWWPSEGNGLTWIANYGIPVIASDWFDNGTLFGGVTTNFSVPLIPPAPALQNKIYVSVTLSDGDNVQYMQHHMKVNWGNASRGSAPIGWTMQPMSVDLDPAMLNYYWSTATTNDCLLDGPSGAGYTHMENWSTANTISFTKLTDGYLRRSGIRAITVWDSVSANIGNSFATNCLTLVGLNNQNGGATATSYKSLPVIGFPGNDNYTSSEQLLYLGITNAAASWNGTAPMFLAVQGSGWTISPADCVTLKNSLDTNKYVMVRPDHLFLLYRQWAGLGAAAALPYFLAQPASQSASLGTNITFNAVVTGSAPLGYQWRFNGTNISSATTNFYIKANVQPTDVGNYSVVITNAAGSVTSSVAALMMSTLLTNVPFAGTWPATKISASAATLNGWAVGNGASTVAWFDWGTNSSYGQRVAATNIGNVYQISPVSVGLASLTSGVIYHYRFAASNNLGTVYGVDKIFSTGGRLQVWGTDGSGLGYTNLPAGMTNTVAIGCGAYHGLALQINGVLTAWGYNNFGQAKVPANLTNAVAVAGGFFHSLALKADSTVVVWGGNTFGQLNMPSGLSNVVAVASGAYHNLALKSDGTVVAWGYNNFGQTNVPLGLGNVVGIGAGIYHSSALRADGSVVAWGGNNLGQTNVPASATNAISLAAGEYHNLAMRGDGTLVAWGSNTYGQTNVPANLTNAVTIFCGDNFNLVGKSDGSLVAWGDNSSNQTNLLPGLTNVTQLACGMSFGLAIGNQLPQATAQTASGFVNHDLTIGLSGNSPDGNSLNYRIASLPAAGALYQFASGVRGANILSPNTPVSDVGGQIIFAPTANQKGSPYASFSFIANDGFNDSAPGNISVNIALPNSPQFSGQTWNSGLGGTFSLSFNGSSNATYQIWGSTNLQAWDWLGTAIESSSGLYQFTDSTAAFSPARYYRVSAP